MDNSAKLKGYVVTVLLASFIQNILIFNEYFNKSSLTFLSLYFETSSKRGLRDQVIMFEDRTLQCITNPLWDGVKGKVKLSYYVRGLYATMHYKPFMEWC